MTIYRFRTGDLAPAKEAAARTSTSRAAAYLTAHYPEVRVEILRNIDGHPHQLHMVSRCASLGALDIYEAVRTDDAGRWPCSKSTGHWMRSGAPAIISTNLPNKSANEGGTVTAQQRLQVGLIGCGAHGRSLADALAASPLWALVACADPDAAARTAVATKPIVPFPTVEELLVNVAVDAVVLATPPDSLYETALATIAAHKHVLAEKPISMDEI